jgi:hypothetical protein
MATSGSNDFNMTRDEIVSAAYRKIQVYRSGETMSAEELFDGCEALNVMIKAWQNKGIFVWLNQRINLLLQKDATSYTLGPAGDHATTSFVTTALSEAVVTGDYWLRVDSISGISTGDYVGYELDDGSVAWDVVDFGSVDTDGIIVDSVVVTVGSPIEVFADGAVYSEGVTAGDSIRNGVAYAGLTRHVTISCANDLSALTFEITGTDYNDDALVENVTGPAAGQTATSVGYYKTVTKIRLMSGGAYNFNIGWSAEYTALHAGTPVIPLTGTIDTASAADNVVYAYTNKIRRPLDIIEVRYHYESGTEIPVTVVDADQYKRIPTKTASGKLVQVYYDPQLDNGVLYVWPVCDDVHDWLVMTVKIPIDDLDTVVDNAQFPPEWLEALIYNLAERLAPEFGRTPSLEVKTRAFEALQEAIQADRGNLPYRFAPNLTPYR